ncbi:hypothetical protein FPQ18DRAFT_403314 [Pyronema domesticum]|uniref:Uncharacterized protein n=1 Tax=Pyronema omphalodes (strain CBS 100304) TaxID=1076935 RepID=U4LHU4_PYROM|nr:hypothetical protein FPQ18DRAFT_403314 [Pyronema domesticum]CCX31493.1 Protein of unknown function [Pyronema omphalodes CBS 100304]
MTQLFEDCHMENLHHNWVEKQARDSRPRSTGMVRCGTGTRFVDRLFYHRKLARHKHSQKLNDTTGRFQRPRCASMDASLRLRNYEATAVPPIVVESITSGVYDLCKRGYIDNCDKTKPMWEAFKHLILLVFYEDGDNIRCELEYFRYDSAKGQFSLGIDKKVIFPRTEELGRIILNEADVNVNFHYGTKSHPNGYDVLSLDLDELSQMVEKTMKALGKKPAGDYVHRLTPPVTPLFSATSGYINMNNDGEDEIWLDALEQWN